MKSNSKTHVAYCSFCGRSNTEVAKVIAGPGVSICSDCVEVCRKIAEQDTESDKGVPEVPSDLLSDEEMLSFIGRISKTFGQIEESLRDWVQRARGRGITWARIGEALGMTRQSAWERFSGEE